MRIDIHSHILPKMDDGAANIDESLKLLKILKDDGVDVVVATPHLYLHKESADDFLRRRKECAETLYKAVQDGDYPRIVLGAEVYFSPALNEMPLKELCIEGTDYIMVELPYCAYSRMFLNQFADFVNGCDCKVIIAHIERYYEYNDAEKMNEILSCECLAQANCESFFSGRNRKRLLKLVESGAVQLLGTDLHSVKHRPPEFRKAESIIRKKLSNGVFDGMMETVGSVLNNESVYI